MAKLPNMKRWSDEKLDREFCFAVAAYDADCPHNIAWLAAIKFEKARREQSQAA